jgi:subtilisin family serine protease/bacillopeptidase F (M6 metalloprotease family)
MSSNKKLISAAAVLLALFLLVPQSHIADEDVLNTPKVSSVVRDMVNQAGPNELVTVIVKMADQASFNGIEGQRAPVFQALRQTAERSQLSLVNSLRTTDKVGKVGIIRQFWIDNIVLVQATKDVIVEIAKRRDVLHVFENYEVKLPPRPEPSQASLDGPRGAAAQTQSQLWDNIGHVGAKDVWTSYGLNGAGVRVGGLDTGVDISHPDIAGKMVTNNSADPTYPGGWAEFDGNGNQISGSVPHDSDEHGTHTTGTMIGGNASGYDIGVAPGASLMHGLVIPGGSGSFAQVAGGMEWIIDPDNNPMTDDGAQVVNMSLGATGTHDAMIAPTDNMVAAGVFPSFSIGNSGPSSGTTGSPGNVPSAFGVGNTDSTDTIATRSSRGPVTWNTPPYVGTWIKPDISAPGTKIYSTVPGGDWQWTSPFGDWSGTSMAAPHVSGTVALMLQGNPTLSVADMKTLLAQTALDLGAAGMDNDYGHGRVNTFAAVSAALTGIGTLEGTVTSSAGGPVQWAQVFITDTGQKVYTDATGYYSIQLVAGDHTVEYSAFGYETQSTVVTIVADVTTTQDVTLTQLPSGEVAGTVYDDNTMAGVGVDIDVLLGGDVVKTGSSDPTTGAYAITLPVGTYDLRFKPPFPYPMTTRLGVVITEAATTPLDVALTPAQVLLVDDDGGDAYESYFEQAILGAGRSYITVTTPPSATEMAQFESVVWFTGDDYTTTLTSADQAELAAFLDAGGRLFITGQDIGYDIRTEAFYADYLHATYVQDDVGLGAVLGDPTSPVGFGFAFDIQGGSGANNQSYPSEMDPIPPALTAFVYDETVAAAGATANRVIKNTLESNSINSSGTAGLSVDNGTYKMVYMSFGFEAIADATTRTAVMDRVLDWLQGYPEIAHEPLGDTEDTENPYRVTAYITSDYFQLDPNSFAVVYDVGGGPLSVPMTATGTPDEYEGYIPAQPTETLVQYYITASDVEGHTSTHPIGAPLNQHSFNVAKDVIPPDVVHTPHRDTNDLEGPYYIYATITDNIGVESVYLMYWKNMEIHHRVKMTKVNGDVNGGEYMGMIPGPSEVGDVYNYHILAMDESYSGNVTRVPAEGSYSFEIVEEFVWDFELDDGGFIQTGDIWEWGTPTYGPDGAHSGVNVWATVLDGTYPSYMDATLDIPAITLDANKPYALFSFWHWYYIETNWDGGNVKISTDGGLNWEIVTPVGGYNGTARSANAGIPGEPCFTGYNNDYWHEVQFDLSAYAGQTIMMRFHAGSDGSVQRDGWYVDDVRLRSTSTDEAAPTISNVEIPASTFDTFGPYTVTATVSDLFSGIASASMFYSTDGGMNWTEVAMTAGTDDEYSADIPGQAQGTRIGVYLKATDVAGNETYSPMGAPADSYGFSILPSAPILVMVSSTSTGATLDDYRAALEAYGYEADYWNLSGQGSEVLGYLSSYDKIILDERSSMSTSEKNAYSDFLESGTVGNKKGMFVLAYNISYYSSNRPWTAEYLRADYVQSDPAWREITGEVSDPIGIGETFVIDGYSPDEVERSDTYAGGEIVYRFTGPGSASISRQEYADWHEKEDIEWDGVTPFAPISLDAAAGMKYNGDTYRSVYFTFTFDFIQEAWRQADITDRVIRWIDSPEIVHTPLNDSEDTLSAYTVAAQVYSADLDPTRVNLTYNVGAGDVTVLMTPTGNPDEYAADIPPQTFGTTVTYYISAANTDGNTSYDPTGAPTERHSFDVTADITPPEIVHSPLGTTADLTGPYTISADVTDNVGVDPAGVSLTWRKNGGSSTVTAMANVGGDTYAADMPGPSVVGDLYEYYILARDVAAVPNTARDPHTGWHSLEIVDYYAWDFETNDGGFSTTGPDWEWGAVVTGPDSAHSGDNVWATKLSSDYSSPSDSRLETITLVVPTSGTYAQLSYWQWYYIETNYDGGNVKLSTDGGSSWTILTPDIGYNGTARTSNAGIPGEPCFTGTTTGRFWHKATFDLTPYKGQPVIIRWHFGSDTSVDYAGWFIDDVLIQGVEDTEGPTFASVDLPTSTFDDVGPYPVTATVIDALAGVASVTLQYSTDGGSSWTAEPMTPTGTANEYGADIPGQASGTRIKLYMEASDNASNSSTDPAGAPASTYEFGIMPSGDYLVLLDGALHSDPEDFQQAFATIGRSADIIDWDDLGTIDVALLEAYQVVIIDHSWYFTSTQTDTLSAWLNRDDGTAQRIFFWGDDLSYNSVSDVFMEQYTGSAYITGSTGWKQVSSLPGDPIGNDETFTTTATSPEELAYSTTYPGALGVYKYTGVGASYDVWESELEYRQFIEKDGRTWDPRMWPLAPAGPDSLAGVRYVGPQHAAVRLCFNFFTVQEDWRRAGILDRGISWLESAASADLAVNKSEASDAAVPNRLEMGQNYPNPFNPTTTLRVGVPSGVQGNVTLKIYNVRGQLVKTMFEGSKAPGWYTFVWDGRNNRGESVSTGVYFARFDDTRTVLTRKMVLLK